MDPIRLGTVEYLNTTPLIEGLHGAAGVTLIPAVPSRMIDLLLSDQTDLALVSLIDLARSTTPLSILPVGMIGCDGPTLTVRLFSARPINSIERIHADTDSHTSVALARVLLKRLNGRAPEIIDFDARERAANPAPEPESGVDSSWPETLLLIGDKVVSDSPPAVRYPHQLDLGKAWHDLTDLPFVYAVWACKADRADDRAIHAVAALLDRTRRRNRHRLDAVVNARADRHGWPQDLAREYVGRLLRYDFDERSLEAARLFLSMAAEDGLVPQTDPVLVKIPDFVPTPG